MARFTLPRDVYHGKGALEVLKTFKGKKAMICVGGGSMKRFARSIRHAIIPSRRNGRRSSKTSCARFQSSTWKPGA